MLISYRNNQLRSLSERLWELEHMISDIYTPYYKEWQKKHGRKKNA